MPAAPAGAVSSTPKTASRTPAPTLRLRDRAPAVMVNDAWHECLTPSAVSGLIDDLRARGEAALSGCHHVVERK